jgi:hypothetical protein
MNIEQKDPQEEIEILLRHSHHQNIVSCRDVCKKKYIKFLKKKTL